MKSISITTKFIVSDDFDIDDLYNDVMNGVLFNCCDSFISDKLVVKDITRLGATRALKNSGFDLNEIEDRLASASLSKNKE